jgi:alcohol sulfotransferase
MQPSGLWARVGGWRDRRRRGRKLLARARTADVAIVSVAKSGRTWLRAMISHLYHQRFGVPEQALINFDDFHALNRAIPRIFFTGVIATDRAPSGRPWAGEVAKAAKMVLLMRDPRDVAVSFYFQMTGRATDRELARKGVADRAALLEMPLFDFLCDERLGVPRAVRFLEDWSAATARHPCAHVISYESLRADTAAAFGALARFLDPEVSEAEIAAAVAFGDFGLMQAREREGFFASDRLRPADAADTETFKVRRGKIGGYRDYLDPDQIIAIDRLVPPALRLGAG